MKQVKNNKIITNLQTFAVLLIASFSTLTWAKPLTEDELNVIDQLGNSTAPYKIEQELVLPELKRLKKLNLGKVEDDKYYYHPNQIRKTLLKKGRILTKINTGQHFKLTRDIYSNIYLRNPENNYQFVLNKNNEIVYIVFAENIINLDHIFNDIDRNKTFIAYNRKKNKEVKNFQKIDISIGSGLEYYQAKVFGDLANTNENANALMFKLESLAHINTSTIISPGMILSYHNSKISMENSSGLDSYSVNIGPSMRIDLKQLEKYLISLRVSYARSLKYKVEDEENLNEWTFKSHFTELALEGKKPIKKGNLLLGIVFRKTWLEFDESNITNQNISFGSQNDSITSIGFNFSLEYDFFL